MRSIWVEDFKNYFEVILKVEGFELMTFETMQVDDIPATIENLTMTYNIWPAKFIEGLIFDIDTDEQVGTVNWFGVVRDMAGHPVKYV